MQLINTLQWYIVSSEPSREVSDADYAYLYTYCLRSGATASLPALTDSLWRRRISLKVTGVDFSTCLLFVHPGSDQYITGSQGQPDDSIL